jgi:hypothetical protein
VTRCLNCGHIEDDVMRARRGALMHVVHQGRNR